MIADEIIAGASGPKERDFLRHELGRAVVVRAQNVADFYWSNAEDQWWKIVGDAAPLTPAWPRMWVEWRQPIEIVAEGRRAKAEGAAGIAFGVHVESIVDDASKCVCIVMHAFQSPLGHEMPVPLIGSGAFVATSTGRLIDEDTDLADRLLAQAALERCGIVQAFGTSLEQWRSSERGRWSMFHLPEWAKDGLTTQEYVARYLMPVALAVVFLTNAFCHCKNVTIRDERMPPKLAKRRRERGHPEWKWKSLVIEPMRRALNDAMRTGGVGLGAALHLCRGHFKTYTTANPLFGRTTGTYWWAPQVRGSAERGAVAKEYEVRPPR